MLSRFQIIGEEKAANISAKTFQFLQSYKNE